MDKDSDSEKKDFEHRLTEVTAKLTKLNLTYTELLNRTALLMLDAEINEMENEGLKRICDEYDLVLGRIKSSLEEKNHDLAKGMQHLVDEAKNAVNEAVVEGVRYQKQHQARKAVIEKLKRDPKQKEKKFVYVCWQEWQDNPERYASKAAFARDMLDKCEHLVSNKIIEDWCREWEKPNSAG
ncbi:hypothetical protein [Nitrosomonas sp.]|uniref:hypothetical protein n=1 Tax=Nitrosomonas sp. TaxID=42353 RepID=UPI0027309247|nr:hypothetical protein [Nitrosomonas sp.]MDP2225801.1 hypothetical protein [Nitrosomonas sp.]